MTTRRRAPSLVGTKAHAALRPADVHRYKAKADDAARDEQLIAALIEELQPGVLKGAGAVDFTIEDGSEPGAQYILTADLSARGQLYKQLQGRLPPSLTLFARSVSLPDGGRAVRVAIRREVIEKTDAVAAFYRNMCGLMGWTTLGLVALACVLVFHSA